MKIKYVKFSDERRKEFCIKTVIGQEDGHPVVYKEAVFEEGVPHIESIASNACRLKEYYGVRVCEAKLADNKVIFDYIGGESLEKRYVKAMDSDDTETIEELLKLHKTLVIGKESNLITYHSNGGLHGIFGDCSPFDGRDALRLCNYDAIASNIIFQDDEPVFIDYEWVFDGPVPVDIVIYHAVIEFYKHYPQMEDVYPFVKAMNLLGIDEDMFDSIDKTYRSFYNYVITDGSNEGFALMKEICRKNTTNVYEALHKVEHENLVNICESNRLQGVIDDLIGQNAVYARRCELYDQAVADYENKIAMCNDRIEGLQAKLLCFGSRRLLRKLKGAYHRWKK